MNQQPIDAGAETKLPFGPVWQKLFAHLLVEDDRFSEVVGPFVDPKYFDGEVEQWLWATSRDHQQRYNTMPSWAPLEEAARKLSPKLRDTMVLGLDQIKVAPMRDAEWVRSTAIEWVRRNVFVRAFHDSRDLYNAGKFDSAYSNLMTQMDRFQEIAVPAATGEESWLFEDLPKRQAQRWERQTQNTLTGTGIPELDRLLGGGLDLGMVGIWMSWSKVGKTTMLINNGKVAARAYYRNVAHFFFEGSLTQITNRYDASFSAELYSAVKRGEWGSDKYAQLFAEYQFLRRKCFVKGFTEDWSYTVEDIWTQLQRLKRVHGWVPDVVVVDYADLLHGRGRFDDGLDSNASAYRDLKTLSTKGRGFAVWTAAQAQKPKDANYDTKPSLLKSSDLGGRYEKVKIADFLASLNATLQERTVEGIMRIWVEAVRDSPAGVEIRVPCDYPRMIFGAGALGNQEPIPQTPTPSMIPPNGRTPVPLGYVQTVPRL